MSPQNDQPTSQPDSFSQWISVNESTDWAVKESLLKFCIIIQAHVCIYILHIAQQFTTTKE